MALLPLSACSGSDMEPGENAGDDAVATASAALAVGDKTDKVCMPAENAAECDWHDGTFQYTSGMCTITVKQECTWVGGQCRCYVKVIATMGFCGPKGWGDFFTHC